MEGVSAIVSSSIASKERALCDDDESEIMGLRHKELPIHGVQFHPESILTQDGKKLLRNFLEM